MCPSRGVAALDALRELDLFRGRQQPDATDLAQVLAHGVGLAMAHVDVDRRARHENLGCDLVRLDELLVLVDDYMEAMLAELVVLEGRRRPPARRADVGRDRWKPS